jgi:HD-GYP domain-containing protein (c-di-GMP phosphodiesterase class II)
MAQVILIEPDKNIHELLSINLSAFVGLEVIPRLNAAEAIALLTILPGIALIITRNEIEQEHTAKILHAYLIEKNAQTELIVTGPWSNHTQNEKAPGIVENPKDWEKTIALAATVLGISPSSLAQRPSPDFVSIPAHYLLNLTTSCCDIFIRIKKAPGEYQYVKRIHNGDYFSKTVVKRYIEQGLESFFIHKENEQQFANFISDQLVKMLGNSQQAPIEEKIAAISQSYQVAIKEILRLGFNSATMQLTESIIENMVKTFESSPEMGLLLHKIINSKTSYMYQHCHMTSVVASECLNGLGVTDSSAHEKMAIAAFFHDISFVDNEELAKISNYEELEAATLSEEDWDLVFNHALEASVLITNHPEAPAEVSEIIKTHHGSLNGKGFAITNANRLTGLSKIFFIACEFVKELMEFKEKGGKPAPIIENLYQKYPDPEMTKVIKALEMTLRKRGKAQE